MGRNLGLVEVPMDAMNVLLSFLTLPDYRNLSLSSHKLSQAVSKASHIRMPTAPLRLGADAVQSLLKRFGSLRVLELDGIASIGDKIFPLLNQSAAASTLQSLCLHGVSLTYWCTDGLHLEHLQQLTVAGGSVRVALPAFLKKLPLESLTLSQCSSLRDTQLSEIQTTVGTTLKTLNLHQCIRLNHPTLNFAQLERLSLMGSFSLLDLPQLNCPNLLYLDLSFCFRINSTTVEDALKRLPQLRELALVKCPGLHSLTIVHSRLTSINVMWSNALHTLRIKCPHLLKLETAGCVALSTLLLDSVSLQSLSLASLHNLQRLEIQAPLLRSLTLTHCRRLDQVRVDGPDCLEQVVVRDCRTVALRFCKSVRRAIIAEWNERRRRRCVDTAKVLSWKPAKTVV